MEKEEPTYEQQYTIPFKVVVESFKGEYFQCGSHAIELNCITSLEYLRELYEQLKEVPFIEVPKEVK